MTHSMTSKIAISLTVLTVSLSGSAAFAGGNQVHGDNFSRNTWGQSQQLTPMPSAPKVQQPNAAGYIKPPAEVWFNQLDKTINDYGATPEDKIALNKDFGSPAKLERVVAWSNTAAAVAKRYRHLAGALKSTPLAP